MSILITHPGKIAGRPRKWRSCTPGRIVEYAEVKPIFGNPMHPYTQGLLKSIPRLDEDHARKARLEAIPGLVPSLLELPPGCKFSNRCKYVFEKCVEEPQLVEVEPGHMVRCWLHEKK
jgi:oligopeptide/dipeptide ABC transporter ATP-binding protein